jgi:lipoprotein-releasing system permease protein
MSKLPFEAFLALRYLRPRRTFVSVITIISILGVTLGVAVLIVVISVMSGFDQEWRNRILGFNAHLKIYKGHPATGEPQALDNYTAVMAQVKSNKNITGVAPFIRGQILIKTQPSEGVNSKYLAPLLLGVDPEAQKSVSILPNRIVQGQYDLEGNALLIGSDFARGMGVSVGSRLAVYSPGSMEKLERKKGTGEEEAPLATELTTRGIFDVGFSEYNSMIVISCLETAQRLYSMEENSVHGLQVMLTNPFLADRIRAELISTLGKGYYIQTWQEENPQIFAALATEKSMMFFLLFFIMIVAGFGIINSQITFVVQKTQEIGILKALGANNRQVLWIFLSQSLVVGVLGVATGLALGLLALEYRNGLLNLIRRTGFDPLPSQIYQLYELPASVEMPDILFICGAAFVACLLAGLFPAWKASRLQPVEALRYE